jgi:AraC-like DNA-binding protein
MAKNKLETFSITDTGKANATSNPKRFIVSDTDSLKGKLIWNEPFLSNEIVIGLCLKGSLNFEMFFRKYTLKENMVWVILPNQIVTLLEKSDDFFMKYLFISVDFIIDFPFPKNRDLLSSMEQWCCMEISPDKMQDLMEYYAMITKRYKQIEKLYPAEITKGLLYSMLLEITEMYMSQEKQVEKTSFSRTEEITDCFLRLLAIHFKEEQKIDFYADKLHITSKHLSSTVKEATGKTAACWMHKVIIAEAKRMLKTTDRTISQISEELNFPNLSSFCSSFKQQTGITPVEFRQI